MNPVRALPLVGFLLLLGCPSIPKAEFDAYRDAFALIKTTAQDLILEAKLAAEESSKDPRSRKAVPARLEELKRRHADLDGRLQALEVVDRYNSALLRMSEGASPEEIRSSLDNLAQTATMFLSGAAKLVEKAVPYLGALSEALSIVDDLIRRGQFKEAIEKGEAFIVQILTILAEDAGALHVIEEERLKMKSDLHFDAIAELTQTFKAALNALKAGQGVSGALETHNALRQRTLNERGEPLKPLAQAPADAAREAGPLEMGTLTSLNDQMSSRVTAHEGILAEVRAHAVLVEEFKRSIASTHQAFRAVREAVEWNSRSSLLSFKGDALRFREAYLSFREARRR